MPESDHPMYKSYGEYSDDQLTEELEWKRHCERTHINWDIHHQSAWYLDKEILCLETLLGQRIKQQAIDEASMDEDDEKRTVELEIEGDLEVHGNGDEDEGDDDDHPQTPHLSARPQPVPPLESPPHPHHYFSNNITTTLPPDTIAPIPFPPSPNISV